MGVFSVAFGIAELGVRWSTTPAFDSARALEHARLGVDSLSGQRWNPIARGPDQLQAQGAQQPAEDSRGDALFHPYFGFDVAISDTIASREVASFQQPEAAKRIDILILGGSVAAEFGIRYFKQIQDALEALPGWKERGVRAYCCARGGFRQPQQLHQLIYLLAIGYRPDIVVELDGFNEVALGLQNARRKVHPVMPPVSHWWYVTTGTPLGPRAVDAIASIRDEQRASQRILGRAESFGLFHSAIAWRFTQGLLDQSHARYSIAAAEFAEELAAKQGEDHLVGPTFDTSDDSGIALSSEIWWRSSLEMDAVCRLWNIRYVHLLQPTLQDEGSKPTTESERRNGALPRPWALGARMGYPLLRARGADLVARGVEFRDLSGLFADVTDELYYDVCHFVPAGHEILLRRVVQILDTQPPQPFLQAEGR
ncbi:MAG TPA: hypothetical protein VM509_08525 [Planctomycetota bacterium]|nr:hypothetical protein [Planctomycetota bacterium]